MLLSYRSEQLVETDNNHYRAGRPITKPNIVIDYNLFIGAIDKTDMILNSVNSEG